MNFDFDLFENEHVKTNTHFKKRRIVRNSPPLHTAIFDVRCTTEHFLQVKINRVENDKEEFREKFVQAFLNS